MVSIQPYQFTPSHLAQLVDLINYCQNIEAGLGIKMAEQSDIFEIETHYQQHGGQFWLAFDQNQVVGCIGLLPLNDEVAVLKKLFTMPEYRGDPHRLGRHLVDEFMNYAKAHRFSLVVLDNPEGEQRSHYFYEKQGFQQVNRDQLKFQWSFPDRDSRFYMKKI